MADDRPWWQPLSDINEFLSRPLFEHPANAYAPPAGSKQAALFAGRGKTSTEIEEDWRKNPVAGWGGGWAYAASTVNDIYNPPKDPMAPVDAPRPGAGPMQHFMAGMTWWGAVSETTYNTPIPGLNLTAAETLNTSIPNMGATMQYQAAMAAGWDTTQALQGIGAANRQQVADRAAIQRLANPATWGMNQEQAVEFGMARRAAMGWEQPAFTMDLLLNPHRGEPMTEPQALEYQARWIVNREADVNAITEKAAYFRDLAQGPIDPGANPAVQSLLDLLGIPTPAEVYAQQARWEGQNAPRADYMLLSNEITGPMIPRGPGAIQSTNVTGGMTTTAGSTYQQNLATPFDPNLGYLELTGATRAQLINWGIPTETITNLANPDEYAKFYGSQDFYTLLAAASLAYAEQRKMPLNQLQDRSIPLMNQMAYDIFMGTDTIAGGITEMLGLGSWAYRAGKAVNLIENVPATAAGAATKMAEGAAGLHPWRFTNEMAQNARVIGGNLKGAAGNIFGVGIAGLGAYGMYQASQTDENEGNRMVEGIAAPVFGAMAVMGIPGMARAVTDFVPDNIRNEAAAHLARAGQTAVDVTAWLGSDAGRAWFEQRLGNANLTDETNRTLNNVRSLWGFRDDPTTNVYRDFLNDAGNVWQRLLRDPRERTFLDIETVDAQNQTIFQIAAKRGDNIMTWLINPGADATTQRLGGDASTWSAHQNALAQAQATGRPLADVMQEVQQFVQGSIIVGQNAAGFDLLQLQRAGLDTTDLPVIDTYSMALITGATGPGGSQKLGDLYQAATGRNLAGAHEASADVLATEAVYNWLTPQVGPQLQREAARFANVPRATGTLAELNRRNLPGTLADLVRGQAGSYRYDDQLDAIMGAFVDPTTNLPLTSDQILKQIQRGEFANIEQYQAVYGRTSGAADLGTLVNTESNFFAQVGATEQGALGFYQFRAEEQIKNRIRSFAPQLSSDQVNNAYAYLKSQYPGYDDPSYLNAILPSALSPENNKFWAQVTANANYAPGYNAAPVARPMPKPWGAADLIDDLVAHMGLETMPLTPETVTDLLFAASGVAGEARSLKSASRREQQQFMNWAIQNPELKLGPHAISDAAVMAMPDVPLSELPRTISDLLGLGRSTDLLNEDAYQRAAANNANLTREQFGVYANYQAGIAAESGAVYNRRGGTIGLPGQREITLPDRASTNPRADTMYRSLVYDYGANLFTGAAQVTDTLAAALESQAQLPPVMAWAYQEAETLLRTQGDAERGLYRVAVDPNDPDQFNKLLALNELAPSTGLRLDLRSLRTVAVPDAAGGAHYEFQAPMTYGDALLPGEANPYSYRNRDQDLAVAALTVQQGQQAQRVGSAGSRFATTNETDWAAYQTGDRLRQQNVNPYQNATPDQLTGAVRADTEQVITRGLQLIAQGNGSWRLPSDLKNLRVTAGNSPTTWDELILAYTENRVVSRVGPSSELVKAPLAAPVFDTGSYVRATAAGAGLFVDTSTGALSVAPLSQSPNQAIASRYTDPATGQPISAVYEDFATQLQAPIQILPQAQAQASDSPFVFNRDDLAPGLQVTTNGQTGTVISRLDDGSYRVAFQRAAHDQPSLQPDTSPFFNLNAEGELAQQGVTFQNNRWGGNTTTYYQNVRPDQIADVYAAGADALNLPLQQARRQAGDDLIAARAETSIDAAAKKLLYDTFNSGNRYIRHAENQPVAVLRRADELLQISRTNPDFARRELNIDQPLNYYLDWQNASTGAYAGVRIPFVEGAPETAGPRGTSAWRSAGYAFDASLDQTNAVSAAGIQQRAALESLYSAWESGGKGRYQPYQVTPGAAGSYEAAAFNIATMPSDFQVLEQLAQQQGLFVQPTRTSITGGLEYTLRPRSANDPASYSAAAQRIGQAAGNYLNQIPAYGTTRANDLVDRYLSGIIPGWGTEPPRGTTPWTSATENPFEPRRVGGEAIYGDERTTNYPNLPQREFERTQTPGMREALLEKINRGVQLDENEVIAASGLGLLDDKVFMRLIPGTVFDAGKGLMVRDQGMRAHDMLLAQPAPGQSAEFTQAWRTKAGWEFYTDPAAAMGMTNARRDPFSTIQRGHTSEDYLKAPGDPIDDLEYIRNVADASTDIDEDPIAGAITYADRNDATTGQRFAATQDPEDAPYDGYGSRDRYGFTTYGPSRLQKLGDRALTPTPQQTTYPIAIVDAAYARQMAQTLNLTWPEGDLPTQFHVGPNAENTDMRLLYSLPRDQMQLAGKPVALTPNSMTVREIQKAQNAEWDARRQLVGNFFQTINQPQYQVRNLEGNWETASAITPIQTGARFDPNNPSATPQYARRIGNRWEAAAPNDPGAILMWSQTPATKVTLGTYFGGQNMENTGTVLVPNYRVKPGWIFPRETENIPTGALWEGEEGPLPRAAYDEGIVPSGYGTEELPPGALYEDEAGPLPRNAYSITHYEPRPPRGDAYTDTMNTAPTFHGAIDLRDWYTRLQAANQIANPERQAAELLKLRNELDAADRFGINDVRVRNLPANYTGRVPNLGDLRTLTYPRTNMTTVADMEVERAARNAATEKAAAQLTLLDEADFGVETDPTLLAQVAADAVRATKEYALEQGLDLDAKVNKLLNPSGPPPPPTLSGALIPDRYTLRPGWIVPEGSITMPEGGLHEGEQGPLPRAAYHKEPTFAYTPPTRNEYTGQPTDFGNNIAQMRRYWSTWWQEQTGQRATRKAWAGAPIGLAMATFGNDDEDNPSGAINWMPILGLGIAVGAIGLTFRPGMLVDTPAGRGIIEAIDDATQEATIRLNDAADGDPAVRGPIAAIRAATDENVSPSALRAGATNAANLAAVTPPKTSRQHVLWLPPNQEQPIQVTLGESKVVNGQTVYEAWSAPTAQWLETHYPALDPKNPPPNMTIPQRRMEIPASQLALQDPSAPRRLDFTPTDDVQPYDYSERIAPSTEPTEYEPGIGDPTQRRGAVYPPATYFTATYTAPDGSTSTVALSAPFSTRQRNARTRNPDDPTPDTDAPRPDPNAPGSTYYAYMGEQMLDPNGNIYYGNRNRSQVLDASTLSNIKAVGTTVAPAGGSYDDPLLAAGAAIPGYGAGSGGPTSTRPAGSYTPTAPIYIPPTPPSATTTALTAMGSPGRPAFGSFSFVNPFADTLTTSAVRFREEMDYVGNLFTAATDNPDNYVTFMRALAEDPTTLVRGIPQNQLVGMDNQANSAGMVQFGRGSLANDKLTSVMPIVAGSSDVLNAMADQMERIIASERSEGREWSPTAFKRYYDQGMFNIGTQWYGANDRSTLTKAGQELAYWQRKYLAEIGLNMNPAQWINNFANNRWTSTTEGFTMMTPVDEAAAQAQAVFRTYGTARADAAEQGMVGSGAYLGYQGGSIFQAHTWANRLVGIPERDYAGNIIGYRGGLLNGLPASTKNTIQQVATNIDANMPGATVARHPDGSPIVDASGNYVYENPASRLSRAGGDIWTTETNIGGQAVGEGAAYTVLTAEAQQRVFREQTPRMFDPIFERMATDPNLDPAIVNELRNHTLNNAGSRTRDKLADDYYNIINAAGGDADAYRNYIANDLLAQHDDLRTTALRTGFATAENVLLESSHQTNLDSWLGNIFAFSYFTTRTAMNWTARTLRQPATMGLFANFATAARIQNENTPGEPNRYAQSVRLWEGGPEVPNLIGSLSGIVKMFGQPVAENALANADTPNEQILGIAALLGMRLLPVNELALGKPPGEVAGSLVPQSQVINSTLLAAGGNGIPGQGKDNPYRRYQAARWLGSQATGGSLDPAVALMAQQMLYEEQWQGGPQREYPEVARAAYDAAFRAVGAEQAFSAYSNLATSLSIKAPVDPNEQMANAYAADVQAIRQLDPIAGNIATDLVPGLQAKYATASIYPDQPEGIPEYSPAMRLSEVLTMPTIGRSTPPPTWQQPAWDTTVGTRMLNIQTDPTKNESPNASQQNNTALYFLRDPRDQSIFYVGQSVAPSNRIVQHIEEVNESDAFSHPKKEHIAEILQDQDYPRMQVFGWYPGNTKTTDDTADKMEMAWIGYLQYVVGSQANVSTLNRKDWEKLITNLGMTKADMDKQFAAMQADTAPNLENVQMSKVPNVNQSVFPDENVPAHLIGYGANNWVPNKTDWDYIMAHPVQPSQYPGVDWGDNQWGLPGIGNKKRSELWSAGFTNWQDVATPSTDEYARLVEIAGSADKAQVWIDKANYTVAVQTGQLPPPPPPPPLDTEDPRNQSGTSTQPYQTINYTTASRAYQPAADTIALPELATFGVKSATAATSTSTTTDAIALPELATFGVKTAAAVTSTSTTTDTIALPELATFGIKTAAAGPPPGAADLAFQQLTAGYNPYWQQMVPEPDKLRAMIPTMAMSTGIAAVSGIAAMIGGSWLAPAINLGIAMSRTPRPVGTGATQTSLPGQTYQSETPTPQRPAIPRQTSQYMYFPGYRPSAEAGQQFWLPNLPNGQQFWVAGNMIASGEDYRDPDYVNNPQFDPMHPETSLARMKEFYGDLQPVPGQYLRTQGAYMGYGPRTSYDQQRTVRTGPSALNANPYGLAGDDGMRMTQGAPDPRTQPELYARWEKEVWQPRGEYGIWLEEPIAAPPNYNYQQTGTGLFYQTKERTSITAAAPGQVVQVVNGPGGQSVVIQHDFGQTIYSNLAGTGLQPGQMLGAGDLVGLSSNSFQFDFRLAGDPNGYTDPTPYLPSTGIRGESGWALTDIPGVNRTDAQMLYDMGFVSPDDLVARGSAAAIDQHPILGAAFDARSGWEIMSAANALLASGANPNPPLAAGMSAIPPSQRPRSTGAGMPAEMPTWRAGTSPAATNRPPSQQARGSINPAISAYAAKHNVDPALLQAVLNIEAGGRTHDADTGQAVARFEVHVFRDTSGIDKTTFDQNFRVSSFINAEYKDPATGEWRNVHANQASEQAAIALAASLTSRDQALYATGQGGAQIMGFHYKTLGYDSAGAMYDAFTANAENQYTGFFDFLTSSGLIDKLSAGDIEGFVTGYNGDANVPTYSRLLREQYALVSANATTQGTDPARQAAEQALIDSAPAATATDRAVTERRAGIQSLVDSVPSLDALQPNIVAGLTEKRLAELVTNTTLRTVKNIADLDASRTADDKPGADAIWLGKQIGANAETAEKIILGAEGWRAPGPKTNPSTIAYLFATKYDSEITGTNLTAADLRQLNAIGILDLQTLAATNPYDIMRRTGLNHGQARNAVTVALNTLRAQGIEIEPNSRTYPKTYTEIDAPDPEVGDKTPLTENMLPGLTKTKIELLAKANITTIGQLAQLNDPKSRWDANWLEANTENKIRYDTGKELAAAAAGWTPITSATNLGEERVRKSLGISNAELETLNALGITDVGGIMTTQARWLDERDLQADYNLPTQYTRTNADKLISGAMRITGTDPTTVKTDPTRTDPRFEFMERDKEGVPGISRQRQTWLYATPRSATSAASTSPDMIDTAAEFMDADPVWLYERSDFKWPLERITAAQNALRIQQGREPVSIENNPWSSVPGQDLMHLNITSAQIEALEQANIGIKRNSYTSFLAAEKAKIAKALNIPEDQVTVLQAKAAEQLRALQAKQQQPSAPTAPGGAPAPAAPQANQQNASLLGPYADFLGVDATALAGLPLAEIEKKVNDKMSTFEQKQMGSGAQDYRMAQFKQQLADPLTTTAQRVQDATDRRNIRTPEPSRGPDISRLVQNTVAGMEDQLAAKIFKQLQRSLV